MAIVQELYFFSWKNFHDNLQNIGDLERLKLVIETVPDGKLMNILQISRAHGRNDYSIEAMWNSVLAGIVFEHAMFDKGYDSTETICDLWDTYGIKPIIDIRNILPKNRRNTADGLQWFRTREEHPQVHLPSFGIWD